MCESLPLKIFKIHWLLHCFSVSQLLQTIDNVVTLNIYMNNSGNKCTRKVELWKQSKTKEKTCIVNANWIKPQRKYIDKNPWTIELISEKQKFRTNWG